MSKGKQPEHIEQMVNKQEYSKPVVEVAPMDDKEVVTALVIAGNYNKAATMMLEKKDHDVVVEALNAAMRDGFNEALRIMAMQATAELDRREQYRKG